VKKWNFVSLGSGTYMSDVYIDYNDDWWFTSGW